MKKETDQPDKLKALVDDQRDKIDTRLFIDSSINDLISLAYTAFNLQGLRYVRREIDRKISCIENGELLK